MRSAHVVLIEQRNERPAEQAVTEVVECICEQGAGCEPERGCSAERQQGQINAKLSRDELAKPCGKGWGL